MLFRRTSPRVLSLFLFLFILGLAEATALAAPATPTGTSPGSTTSPGPTQSSSNVTLSWNASTGATYYGLGVRDLATNVLVVDTNVTSTSYTANLSAGKQYRWNVNACNSTGCSSYTTPLYFQTPAAVTIPATPTGTSPGSTSSPGPTQSSSTVTLSWNSSSGAITYGVGVRDMSTNVLVVDTNVSGTSYTAGLTAGRPYRWNVNACNSAGCSSYTTPLYFQTPSPVTIPSTPTGTSPGSTSSPGPITSGSTVMLSWNGSAGATYYGLGVRDLATNVLVVDTNVSGTSYSASLSAGNQYRWNVNACNSAGCSSYTTPLYFQTPSAATLPGAPQNLAAFGGNGQNGLGWNAPSSNGGATITSYRVFRGTTNSNQQLVTSGGCANLGAVLGCTDTGLTNGQIYYYIVSAVNSVGQGPPSNQVSATPAAVPGSFTLSNQAPVCDTNPPAAPAIRLNWGASSGATSYDLYRNGSLYATGLTGTTFYNSANVTAGQTYTYFVRANNASGSTNSNTITVVVPGNICASVAPDFAVSANQTLTVSQGSTAQFTLTVQSLNGFNSAVSLYALNLPVGYVAQGTAWNPQTVTPAAGGAASSVLSIVTNGSTQTGSSVITLRAVSGGITREVQVTLTVVAGGDFSITASPSSRSINQGDSTTYTLTVNSLNGFSSPVSVYALNLPTGYVAQGTAWSASAVTPPANGSASTTLTVLTNGTTQTGTTTVTLRATGNGLTRDFPVSLTVAPVVNAGFTVAATPTARSVAQGGTTTFTLTVTSQNGFSSPVSVSALSLPPGYALQGTGWSQTTVTPPANGSVSTTLTVVTNGSTQIGTFPVALRGVSGGLMSEAAVSLTVTGGTSRPVASFTVSPASPAVNQTVQFTDTSSGSSLSWSWDFDGNGTQDSTQRNPTHQFAAAGTQRVLLTVNSPYGSDTYAQDVQVTEPATVGAPVVTSVSRQYPGVFLQGGYIDLRFDVGVDWKGSVGRVQFVVNNGAPIVVNGTAAGASRTFRINQDFPAGTTPSTVKITPINAAGVAGTTNTQYVHVFPLPRWLVDAIALSPTAFREIVGATNLEYSIHTEFPRPHLGQNNLLYVPSIVPYLGDGPFGLAEVFVSFDGKVSPATGTGSLGAAGNFEFRAMNNVLKANIGATGKFQLVPPSGLTLTEGVVNLNLEGTLSREEGIVSAIPSLRPTLTIPVIGPFIKKFSDAATLRMELTPSLKTTFRFSQNVSTGSLGFSDGTATLGVNLKAVLSTKAGPLKAEAWVSGGGSGTFGVPEPFVRRLEINAQAGAKFSLSGFFDSIDAEAHCDFGFAWTPQRGVAPYSCFSPEAVFEQKLASALSNKQARTISLIEQDYSRFGTYAAFQPRAQRKQLMSSVPASVFESTLVTNLFPDASPSIIEAGNGKLLLYEHQVPTLPVPQSTDIAWSYNNGSTWSAPAFVKQDTQAELSPVAGVDADGNAVAAWLRIKTPAFTTPVNTTADLPLFYKQLEVVSSVFRPASQTWGNVTPLTDDTSLDTDLQLSADQAGRLMLTWLSNSNAEFVSSAASPSVLKYSFWDGSAWSAPAPVASNLVGVSGHAAAAAGTRAFAIVPRDPDPAVEGDAVLDLYTWNGSAWSAPTAFAAGGGDNRLPTAVYDSAGEGHVVWVRGGDLVHATLSNRTPEVARAGSSSLSFSDARLMVNPQGNLTLLWQQTVDNGPANLFAMLYDPLSRTWSADRRLNVDSAMSHDVKGYYGRDNQLHAVYLSTQIARTSQTITVGGEPRVIENIPQSGRADLHVLDHPLINDLAVSDNDLRITPREPQAGDTVTASLTIYNAGDFAIGNFPVNLYVGSPDAGGVLVGTTNVLETIRAGDQRETTFTFTYPSGGGNIVAVVDGVNSVAELTKANNRATAYANNTAPQASIAANVVSGTAPLTVNLDASSSFDSEGDAMSFSWAFADGSQSSSGAQVTHTFGQPGTYPVTLAVTDARGAVGTAVVLITVAPGAATVQFTNASVTAGENAGRATLSVTRGGDTTSAVSVDVRTVDNTTAVGCADTTTLPGVAFARCDYATTIETLNFAPGETSKSFTVPLIDDTYVEPNETVQIALSNPTGGATFGASRTMTLTITSDDTSGQTNPILRADATGISFFVRQQYLDFLSREPEQGEPWSALLAGCPNQFNLDPDSTSRNCDRIGVSYSIFASPEFQIKGAFIFRFHRVAFVNPADAPANRYLPGYDTMIADMRSVTGITPAEVYAKKAAFANAFVQRPEFLALFPLSMSSQQFVDTLMSRYSLQSITTFDPNSPDTGPKVMLSRADLVNSLNAATMTRAGAVRAIADSDQVAAAELNPAFVAVQYYGYLRRTPEPGGYGAWLDTINANPADVRSMVNGFLNSVEYRLRFGQP